jgi:thiol-disulfide isomerase/thioredoxin
MPITRCATPDDAAAALAAVQTEGGSALFLFFGSEDPQTGASWCADCVTADPVLRRACRELRPDLTLYECPVGARSAWKNQPEHPYRQHPAWRLARIPTLILFEHGNERGRLVEADCANVAAVRAFLSTSERALSG